MTELQLVVERAYERAHRIRALPSDRLGPDASWVPRIIMIAVVRVALPEIRSVGRRQQITAADIDRILAGFAGTWWDRAAELVASVGPLCSAALQILRDEHAKTPRGAKLRSLREKTTIRLADVYLRLGRMPDHQERRNLCEELVWTALLSSHEVMDDDAFVSSFDECYAEQEWSTPRPTPEQIRLGSRLRPPLSDSALRSTLVGTDRDVFSRYRLYYDLRGRSAAGRSAADPSEISAIERFLSSTATELVAQHELRRSAHPYGLAKAGHHAVLPAALQALSAPAHQGPLPRVNLADEADQPLVDGTDATIAVLHSTYAGVFRRSGWHTGINLEDLEGYVMRRLWNDLHRWERENESTAARRWFVARLKCALTQYPRERAVIAKRTGWFVPAAPAPPSPGEQHHRITERRLATGDELTATAAAESVTVLPPAPPDDEPASDPAPEELMHTAIQALAMLTPTALVQWFQEAAERGVEDATAMVAPACQAKGLSQEAQRGVGFLALQVLRSAAPS